MAGPVIGVFFTSEPTSSTYRDGGALPSYNIGRTMIASGPETLLAITQDGWLIEINVTTGDERRLRQVGPDSENFALVR